MTNETFAQHLNGVDVSDGIPEQCIEEARKYGIVIVYGLSDDLIEFDGAIHDEAGVSDGDIIKFDAEGVIPEWDTIEKEIEQEVRDYFKRVDNTEVSEILVKESHGSFYWSYDTDIPHEKFHMLEDGEPYCEGIVFNINDLKGF
jgi:hypothetical protein